MLNNTMTLIALSVLLYALIGIIVGVLITRMWVKYVDLKPTFKDYIFDVLAHAWIWPVIVIALLIINIGTLITEGRRKKQ